MNYNACAKQKAHAGLVIMVEGPKPVHTKSSEKVHMKSHNRSWGSKTDCVTFPIWGHLPTAAENLIISIHAFF